MPNRLISGPAGAGKSQRAVQVRAETSGPTILLDFQSLYAAILGLQRGPDGRFPERLESDQWALPLTEYVRRAAITGARNRDIGIVATNSDGDPQRRRELLARLGPGSVEEVIDEDEATVLKRLSRPGVPKGRDGRRVSRQCRRAVDRWFRRRRR